MRDCAEFISKKDLIGILQHLKENKSAQQESQKNSAQSRILDKIYLMSGNKEAGGESDRRNRVEVFHMLSFDRWVFILRCKQHASGLAMEPLSKGQSLTVLSITCRAICGPGD